MALEPAIPMQPPQYVSFDRAADFYDETRFIPPGILTSAAGIILDDLGGNRRLPFLDAGIGTGRFARHLAAAGLKLVGLDISEAMIRKTLGIRPRVGVVRADLRAMPLRSERFEGCLIVHVLHLVSDWQRVVQEIRRVLLPEARLYVGVGGDAQLATRALYFQLAGERGYNRPHVGAPSFAAVLEHLAQTGADIHQIDAGRLRWRTSAKIGETLGMLRRNPFSHLWHVPSQAHDALMEELERRRRLTVDSLDEVETADASFGLWRVTWNSVNGGHR